MARRVVGLGAIVLGIGGLAACEPPPPPTVFVVSTTVDAVDDTPGDGLCATSGGACSLRAAIQEANTQTDRVVIELAPGATYELTVTGADEDAGATGDLDVAAGRLTIHGHGATITAGRRSEVSPYPNGPPTYRTGGIDRVLDHRAGSLTVDDVTITGGYVPGSGAGIRNASDLVLVRVTVVRNETSGVSPGGQGIHHVSGLLMLIESSVSYNLQKVGDDATGPSGGLFQGGGTAHVLSSTIEGNTSVVATATYHPLIGGFWSDADFAGYRQTAGNGYLVNSRVAGHHFAEPACVYAPTSPPNCTGTTSYLGGGVHAEGHLEIVASRLVANNDEEWGSDDLIGAATVGGSIIESCVAPSITSRGFNRVGTDCPVAPTDRVGGSDVDQIPIGTPRLCDGSIATDRLGVARPQGQGCDIGDEEH